MVVNFKKVKKICSIFIVFFMLFGLTANFNVYNVKALEVVSVKRGVDINKLWNVKFNEEINKSSNNLSKVKIYDQFYNLIDASIAVSENGKELKIRANENYKAGSKYYLYIDKGFQSISGQTFNKEMKMEFETIRKLPADLAMEKSKDNRFTIGIDAGQTFKDYVKYEDGTLAKEINLDVAMKVGKYLESSGAKVIYTRKENSVSWNAENDIENRARINEDGQTDLLLSINCNIYDDKSVNGIETYYLNGREQEKNIAQIIQSNLIEVSKANDRGIKTKDEFELFEKINSPAVMIHLGFLSNKEEGKLLTEKSYQDKLAKSIAESIIKYVGRDKIEEKEEVAIKNLYDEVQIGGSYSLPKDITAKLADGTKEKREIQWNRVSIDTNKEGTYYSYGKVNGFNGLIVMNLEVKNKGSEGNDTDKESGGSGGDGTDKEEGIEDNTDKDDGNKDSTDKDENTDKEDGKENTEDKDNNKDQGQGTEDNTDKEDNKEYKYIVALNPSRGGQDQGITGVTGLKEKDLNLEVAKKAGMLLETEGVKVIYTRTEDEDVYKSSDWTMMKEIEARVKKAEDAGAQLMVSIGGNSFKEEATQGIETFYNKSDAESKKLAKIIQDNLVQETSAKYRGYKEVDYYSTLKLANIPSTWATVGFLTNKEEEENLKKEEYKNKLALAISNGVMEYLNGVKYNEYEYITKEIKQGSQFELPKTIGVRNSNGEVNSALIIWENDKVETRYEGIDTYRGKVEGTNKILVYTIIISADSQEKEEEVGKPKVLLDPGHGGYDSGAVGPSRTREKDITLSVSLKVGDYLVKNGVDVSYTRTSDKVSWPSEERADLQARVAMSNNLKPDIYVSVHCNSFQQESAHGIETYYFDGSSTGRKLAELVQNNLVKSTGQYNRNIKTADYYVIKHTDATAILTEIGFISNNYEEKLISSNEGQDKIAKAIATGILNYFGIYDIKFN